MVTGLLVAITAVVVSCAPTPPDPDDLAAWMRDWAAEQDDTDGLVASATAVAGRSVVAADQSDGGITVTLSHPEPVSSFEFSCYGDGTMRFSVMVRQGSSHIGFSTAEPLACANGPHTIAAPDPGAPVSEITFTGFDASNQTAWGATAHR